MNRRGFLNLLIAGSTVAAVPAAFLMLPSFEETVSGATLLDVKRHGGYSDDTLDALMYAVDSPNLLWISPTRYERLTGNKWMPCNG